MKTLSLNDLALAIYEFLFGKENKELAEASKKVVIFLKNRGLLGETEKIFEKVEQLVNKKENKTVARLLSAEVISPENKKTLSSMLQKKYATEKIEFKERIDKKLLGGFRIEVGDEVMDNTISGKLKKLQGFLTN